MKLSQKDSFFFAEHLFDESAEPNEKLKRASEKYMKLSEALSQGQQKYQEAKKREMAKRKLRPVTTSGLIQFFADLYHKHDLGKPPNLSKQDRGKISGLIKLLKNNGYESQDIYEFIESVFENWNLYKQKEFLTLNKKKYRLSNWPDLIDIVNCREQFIRELHSECQDDVDEDVDLLKLWEQS